MIKSVRMDTSIGFLLSFALQRVEVLGDKTNSEHCHLPELPPEAPTPETKNHASQQCHAQHRIPQEVQSGAPKKNAVTGIDEIVKRGDHHEITQPLRHSLGWSPGAREQDHRCDNENAYHTHLSQVAGKGSNEETQSGGGKDIKNSQGKNFRRSVLGQPRMLFSELFCKRFCHRVTCLLKRCPNPFEVLWALRL